MAATAQAIVQVKAQGAAQTNQEFQNIRKNITGNMTAAERSVASSLSSMAAQYISLGLVIRQVGKTLSQGVEFNKFIENQTMAFEVMMKSADKAKAKVQELYDFAVVSPLTFKETVSSSKQLMAYGFAAEELVPTMEKLGTVSIATGHSLADIAYVYGTLKSQGRAYSRDLMQFGMRGIPIYEELAKVLKVDVTQIQKMASEGKIGFKEVERAFANMTEEGGRFGGILDKYMETLTGKIAMLSDIWEQSTGKMAEGFNKVLGKAVDELTQKLESGDLDGFIQGISDNVAGLAQALLSIAKVLIEIAPLLATIAKIWIGMKITGAVTKGITGLFKGFVNLSEVLFTVSSRLQSFTTLLYSVPTIMATNTASIVLFKDAILGLATALIANPVTAALLGIVAVGGVIVGTTALIINARKDMREAYEEENQKIWESDEKVRKHYLQMMIQSKEGNPFAEREIASLGEGKAADFDLSNLNFDKISKIATDYKVSIEDALEVFKTTKQISQESYNNMMLYMEEQKKSQEWYAEEARRMVAANQQMDFLATLTGATDPKTFLDTSDKLGEKYTALGGKGAKMYIAGFEAERDKKKNLLGDLFTDKMMKDSLQKELDSLYETLFAGMDLDAMVVEYDEAGKIIGETLKDGAFYEFSTFDEEILARIEELQKLLADGAGKAKKEYASLADTLKELGRWWLPDEARVRYTLDAFDDMGLELRKQLATLDAETETRLDTIAKMGDEVDKAKLLHELAQDRAQAEKDIYKYMEQQADILQFQENLSGKTNYWQGIEAQAGQGNMGAVAMTSMEGTEIGNVIAGADPMTMVIKALADFAMTIENISKLMAPLNTILEAGRPLFELFINSALQDMVNQLSALGVIIGKILAPILSLTQLFFLFSNTLYNLLLLPLEGLGWAFAWLNDVVIVYVGNGLIDFVNELFTLINDTFKTSLPLLERLKKTTDTVESFSMAVSNLTNSLTNTISYLLDKFNSYIDEQVNSYQDLYEVGAISGAEYEKMVAALGDKLDPSMVNVSASDKALEDQEAILLRLGELYGISNQINNGNLTEEQKKALLEGAGLMDTPVEALMMQEAFKKALELYGASTDKTLSTTLEPFDAKGILDSMITKMITKIASGGGGSLISTLLNPLLGQPSNPFTDPKVGGGFINTHPGQTSDPFTDPKGGGGGGAGAVVPANIVKQFKAALSDPRSFLMANGVPYGARYGLMTDPQKLIFDRYSIPYSGSLSASDAQSIMKQEGNVLGLTMMPAYAKGTPNVPYDMMAQIHEGEGIIPKTFMDGVRSGEISIGRGGHGGDVYVSVNVEGNVTAEKDLAISIAEVLYSERRAGRVAV